MEETVLDVDFLFLDGQHRHLLVLEGVATFGEGAVFALRVLWGTLDGAHFHKCLIVAAGVLVWEVLGADFLNLLACGVEGDVVEDAEVAADEAEHIAIHGGVGEVEGDGADGGGGVVADSFQLSDFLIVVGKFAVVVSHYGLCGSVHIPGAAIIAKALPHFENIVFRSVCQGLNIGEMCQEIVVIRNPLNNPCLLQDDFGNPNFVGITFASPWQVAMILIKPREKNIGKIH